MYEWPYNCKATFIFNKSNVLTRQNAYFLRNILWGKIFLKLGLYMNSVWPNSHEFIIYMHAYKQYTHSMNEVRGMFFLKWLSEMSPECDF